MLHFVKFCNASPSNLIGLLIIDNDDESLAQMLYLKSFLDKLTPYTYMENIKDLKVTYSSYACKPTFKLYEKEVECLLNQYPKEWLVNEIERDELLKYDLEKLKSIEPWWKLILSNKALLPMLWSMFPQHPNLLPSYYDNPTLIEKQDLSKINNNKWVSKPLFGREGVGILHSKNYSSFG